MVHVDDFVIGAEQSSRASTEEVLRDAYEVKVDLAGPRPENPKDIKIL